VTVNKPSAHAPNSASSSTIKADNFALISNFLKDAHSSVMHHITAVQGVVQNNMELLTALTDR